MQTGLLKSLTIIHTALLIGATAFTVIAVFIGRQTAHVDDATMTTTLLTVAALMLVGSQFMAAFLFSQRLQLARQQNNPDEKLGIYRSALIVKMALLEGPVMFCAVVTLITGNLLGAGMGALGLVAMALQKPGVAGISDALNLSPEERHRLENE